MRREPHYGIPKALQGIGLAIALAFLLWAVAMVLAQAWQATQTHGR